MGVAVRKLFETHDAGRRADWRELLAFDALRFMLLAVIVGLFGLWVGFQLAERVDEAENMVRRVGVAERVRLEAGGERKREHEAWKHGLAAVDHQVDGGAGFGLLRRVVFGFRIGGTVRDAVPFADSCLLFFFLLFSHDVSPRLFPSPKGYVNESILCGWTATPRRRCGKNARISACIWGNRRTEAVRAA